MESISLPRGGSLPKLPLYAPSSSISTRASRLRFDLRTPSFPQLSNSSISVSIAPTWNFNIHNKFLARCGNVYNGKTHSDAIEDPLKSLFSLVQPKETNSLASITYAKNEALKKLVVYERYNEAECQMKHLVYEARLAHIQILIHLEEYNKALEFLENFPKSKQFDARLRLYKAVVHTMLDHDDEAKKWWNSYLETLGDGNANDKLNTQFTNTDSITMKDAKSILQQLLNLKPTKMEKDTLSFEIISRKKEALMNVVNGEYKEAEFCMRGLCRDFSGSGPEKSFAAQMALVEILINLDKYDEALNCLHEKQNHFIPSDASPFLYMAIGLTVVGNHKDAKICWKAFMETIGIKGLPRPQ